MLKDPYGRPPSELSRITSDIPHEDKNLIRSFTCSNGIYTIATKLFFNALANDARKFLEANPAASLDERTKYLERCVGRRTASELTDGPDVEAKAGRNTGKDSGASRRGNKQSDRKEANEGRNGRKG